MAAKTVRARSRQTRYIGDDYYAAGEYYRVDAERAEKYAALGFFEILDGGERGDEAVHASDQAPEQSRMPEPDENPPSMQPPPEAETPPTSESEEEGSGDETDEDESAEDEKMAGTPANKMRERPSNKRPQDKAG